MADATVSRRQKPSPLEDLTNESIETQDAPPKTLRRNRSPRALYRQLDSSESFPSFNESIWEAEAVRSDEYHAENGPVSPQVSPTTIVHAPADVLRSLALEDVDEIFDLPRQSQRSASLPSDTRAGTIFHPTQLEPIAEQRSIASLHSSFSRARLSQSPVRNVTVIHPQQSHHSLYPSQRQEHPRFKECLSPPSSLLKASSHHRRAFSLDDLDCFKLTSLNCSGKQRGSSSSSSSESRKNPSLGEKASKLAEPRKPSQPPPERSPTPPGIPSFGSPEAIHYFNRPRARSLSWWRVGRSAQPEISPVNASAAARALSANLNAPPSQPERPSRVLRCLSLFNDDPSQASSRNPRRASLPAGVLRADDGTFVRGRFGGRVSGHGISSRGLDGHPIQRAAAAPRETKGNPNNDGFVAPRQRASTQRQAEEPAMSGAVAPDSAVRRNASFSSLLTIWLSREGRSTHRQPQTEAEPREPRIVDVAAGVDEFLGRNGATAQPHLDNDDGQPRPSTDNNNAAHTASDDAAQQTTFWHCWRWFCICCCEMSEAELDGCGWYGADRPWLREGRESVRLRNERRRREEERAREEERRNASWDSVSELRRQTGLRMGVGRGMRFRPGGSQGGSQGG